MRVDTPIPGTAKSVSIKAYRKTKLKMLQNDFKITLTEAELKHVNELKSEVAIDQFCLGILNNRWN